MSRFTAASQPFAALFGRQSAFDAVTLHEQVNQKIQLLLVLVADDGHFVSAGDGVGIVAQHAALVVNEGMDGGYGRITFRHPSRNINAGNATAVQSRIEVEKANLV